jgi:hypothetical protein
MTTSERYPIKIRITKAVTYKGGMRIEPQVLPARMCRPITVQYAKIAQVPLGSHPGYTVQHPGQGDPLIGAHIPADHAIRVI